MCKSYSNLLEERDGSLMTNKKTLDFFVPPSESQKNVRQRDDRPLFCQF